MYMSTMNLLESFSNQNFDRTFGKVPKIKK